MFIFFTIILVAISLSMDTFSLSLSYGMLNLEKSIVKRISLTVGICHFIMPLLGQRFGQIIENIIPFKKELVLGIVFLIITFELIESLKKKENIKIIENNLDILILAISVSVDSFTTGIALDVFKISPLIIVSVFFIISSLFTYLGLTLGSKIGKLLGNKAKIIGVILLILLSINYIIKGVK